MDLTHEEKALVEEAKAVLKRYIPKYNGRPTPNQIIDNIQMALGMFGVIFIICLMPVFLSAASERIFIMVFLAPFLLFIGYKMKDLRKATNHFDNQLQKVVWKMQELEKLSGRDPFERYEDFEPDKDGLINLSKQIIEPNYIYDLTGFQEIDF